MNILANKKSEEYLDNLLNGNGDPDYISEDDFLREIEADFPELNDDDFMRRFADDVDNTFEEDMERDRYRYSLDREKKTESEPIFKAAVTPASYEDVDTLDYDEESSEAVNDAAEMFLQSMSEEEPIIRQEEKEEKELKIDDDFLASLEEFVPVAEPEPAKESEAETNETASDLTDDSSLDDNSQNTASEDVPLTVEEFDLDALMKEASEGISPVEDYTENASDTPSVDPSSVGTEFAGLFDDTDARALGDIDVDNLGDIPLPTDLTDSASGEAVSSGFDDDLDDINNMLASEDLGSVGLGDSEEDGIGIDVFEGLEGLDTSFDMDSEMSAEDILGQLGADISEDDSSNEKKGKKDGKKGFGGFKGFLEALFASTEPDEEEPALSKEEKKALKEQKKKEKEEQKKAKAAAKPKKEKGDKAAEKAAKQAEKERKKAEKANEPKGKPLPKVRTFLILLLAVSIIVLFYFGVNFFGYKFSMDNIKSLYTKSNYTECYNLIKEMDVKENDLALKNKIILLSKLQNRSSSANSLMQVGMYPEALDHLLKAVAHYDSDLNSAVSIGCEAEYNAEFNKVSDMLLTYYKIGVKRAREINALRDNVEFSRALYDVSDAAFPVKDKKK